VGTMLKSRITVMHTSASSVGGKMYDRADFVAANCLLQFGYYNLISSRVVRLVSSR